MSLASNLLARAAWLRRCSLLRLVTVLSLNFAAGFAVAVFVALILGQNAIERRLDATLAALASAALEEACTLSEVFDTIMRVARIEAGQGRDGFERVDLAALADDLAETFGAVVEEAGKQLHLECIAPAHVEADRGMLVQAMANLIQNALLHGGEKITLMVNAQSLGVADNGPGVERAALDEIIKPMVRLDRSRSTPETGLGLALVRAVADRHGARLVLSPNTPQGLRVLIEFAKR